MDREKVVRAFEQYVYNFVELTTTDEYNHQILEQVLALLKEQEEETIECEMCGHRLQKDWNWCPWCRWETAGRSVK